MSTVSASTSTHQLPSNHVWALAQAGREGCHLNSDQPGEEEEQQQKKEDSWSLGANPRYGMNLVICYATDACAPSSQDERCCSFYAQELENTGLRIYRCHLNQVFDYDSFRLGCRQSLNSRFRVLTKSCSAHALVASCIPSQPKPSTDLTALDSTSRWPCNAEPLPLLVRTAAVIANTQAAVTALPEPEKHTLQHTPTVSRGSEQAVAPSTHKAVGRARHCLRHSLYSGDTQGKAMDRPHCCGLMHHNWIMLECST